MSTTSAHPGDLAVYVAAAGDGTSRLTTAAGGLRDALDHLRAADGTSEFLADVPEVDLDLSFLARRWDGLASWLDGVAQAFTDADGGDGAGLRTVDDGDLDRRVGRFAGAAVEVIAREGRLILDAGVGDDVVVVADRGDHLLVTVNGTEYRFDLASDDEVLVRLGQGDDTADPSEHDGDATRSGLVLDGGSGHDDLQVRGGAAVLRGGSGDDLLRGSGGNDRIIGGDGVDDVLGQGGDDRVIGGDGADTLDGGLGDDWVSGGEGEDLLYGQPGADLLVGGIGRDHIDGGSGVDHVEGASGADVLSGGMGHDTVHGGAGDDAVYSGPGHDLAIGGSGADALHVEPDDVVGDAGDDDTVAFREVDLGLLEAITIDVGGSTADRIRSDLVTLASTRAGARLLASLRGHVITVRTPFGRATAGDGGDAYDPWTDEVQYDPRGDEAGFGPAGATRAPGTLSYSPLLSLGHELIHASHDVNGTRVDGAYRGTDLNQRDTNRDGRVEPPGPDRDGDGEPDSGDRTVPNEERSTVGLPVDPDEDASTPDVPASEVHEDIVDVTENSLRDELGLEPRGRY